VKRIKFADEQQKKLVDRVASLAVNMVEKKQVEIVMQELLI